jgi:hypothetical protein
MGGAARVRLAIDSAAHRASNLRSFGPPLLPGAFGPPLHQMLLASLSLLHALAFHMGRPTGVAGWLLPRKDSAKKVARLISAVSARCVRST